MSLYGTNLYGLFTYGSTSLTAYDASPMYANSTDYNTVSVYWNKPGGTWTTAVLVRNKLGFPVTPDDGTVVVSYAAADHPTNAFYKDTTVDGTTSLSGNQIYYYAVFVDSSAGVWVRAGNTMATSVKNYGTTDLMYSMVPRPYKTSVLNNSVVDSFSTNQDLYNFLKVFGFEYDLFKSMAENITARYDVNNLSGKLIPAIMNQFGLNFEHEMGLAQGRRLLKNIAEIYLSKGTTRGIRVFASAFTGYPCTVSITNLMLSLNNSSFESGVGDWTGDTNCTISQITGASESPTVSPYSESLSPANYPNGTAGLLKMVSTAVSSGAMIAACGSSSPLTKGIPVTAGVYYTLSFKVMTQSGGSSRTVYPRVSWYTYDGTLLYTAAYAGAGSTSVGSWSSKSYSVKAPGGTVLLTSVTSTTTTATFTSTAHGYQSGQKVTISGVSDAQFNVINATISSVATNTFTVSGTFTTTSATAITGTAVATSKNAAYAVVAVQINGTVSPEVHYVDAVQFERATAVTTYADARRIDVSLTPNRTNYAINPTFASATTNWTTTNATSSAVSSAQQYSGANSMLVTANGSGAVSIGQNLPIAVTAGTTYTWSMYVRNGTATVSYAAKINWFSNVPGTVSSGTLISTSTGTTTAVTSSGWTRVTITATAPSTALSAGVVIASTTTPSNTHTVYVDAALFEPDDIAGVYFDGSGAGYYQAADVYWAGGDATNGKSYYYLNRVNALIRLKAAIPDYLPFGSNWALITS